MADNRETITIKLRPGKDDDLIAWWNSLPKGDYTTADKGRNQMVKSALRAALDLPIPEQPAPTNGRSEADLETLRGEWESWTKELLNNLPSYIAQVVEDTVKHIDTPSEPLTETAPELSKQDLQTREAKLKKARW